LKAVDVISKDEKHVNPRTAKRNGRLREIVAEIRYNLRFATYGEKIAEIERRYGVSRAQACEDFDDCDRFAPEHLAANAGRIKSRLLLGAESVLDRGEDLVEGSRDAAAIAQARAQVAKAIEDLDPTRWITSPEAVTAILLGLTQCELSAEQEEILRRFAQRLDDVRGA
jgi:hypothetical protein